MTKISPSELSLISNNTIEGIIHRREISGMKIAINFRLYLFGIFIFINMVTQYENNFAGQFARYLTEAFVLTGTAVGLYFLNKLKQGKWLNPIGYAVCLFDCLLLCLLPFIWQASQQGSEGATLLTLTKNDIGYYAIAFMVLNSLSLKMIFPLIVTFVSFALKLALLAIAYPELLSKNLFASTYLEAAISNKLMLDGYFTSLFLLVCSGICVSYLARVVRNTIVEASLAEKESIQISRYFSPAIAQKIKSANSEFMKPGGTVQDVGILFSDIRNFTTLSEKLKPEETMQLLSEYHKIMVEVIFKHSGTLDKFIGDGIMATFGTPQPNPQDAENTILAALEMRQALYDFNESRARRGLPVISAGIGIHYGSVIAGNIGTPERLEYTVIGDAVNVASRIESSCKKLGTDLLVSKNLLDQMTLTKSANWSAQSVGTFILNGKSTPIELYTLISLSSPTALAS